MFMSHLPGNLGSNWLSTVASLLKKKRQAALPRGRRRLAAEPLERRTVLSVAPLADEASVSTLSLDQYLAQQHELGPVAPLIENVPTDASSPDAVVPNTSAQDSLSAVQEPAPIDHYFNSYAFAGEGEGSGSGSGSASGSGSSAPDAPPTITDTSTKDLNGL